MRLKKDTNSQLKTKREKARQYRQRISADPVKREEEKRKKHMIYLRAKENGTIKLIDNLSASEVSKKRQNWRIASQKYLEKRKQLEMSSSIQKNPVSIDIEKKISQMKVDAEKKSRKRRRKHMEQLDERNREIKKLKSLVEKYKKRATRANFGKEKLMRRIENYDLNSLSPKSKTTRIMRNIKTTDPKVKRQILFGEVMKTNLSDNFKNLKTDKEKQIFTKIVWGKKIRTYAMQRECSSFLTPKRILSCRKKSSLLKYERRAKKGNGLQSAVTNFLEQDENSRMCPGKRDFVRKGKFIKQKRFLNDTLQNLYTKFVGAHETFKISYKTFCRCCPFWIRRMNARDRETCLCEKCANMDLLIESLFRHGIIDQKTPNEVIKAYCCENNAACLLRECIKCRKFSLEFKNFPTTDICYFYKWSYITESYSKKAEENKSCKKIKKLKIDSSSAEIIKEFKNNILEYLQHKGRIRHQFAEIKKLKENLKINEALIHMDFSENLTMKYAKEIHSFHFGGSRQQISLHTVVAYTIDANGKIKTHSFCTLSESTQHNVPAIWAHLRPVLETIFNDSPVSIDRLHFLSDSPSTQYRNKYMFHCLGINLKIWYPDVQEFTWNYSEAGHGKGAPDGVGAVCKRVADRFVAEGKDIVHFETLLGLLKQACSGINFFPISKSDIDEHSKMISHDCKPFPGTMQIHQVMGSKTSDSLNMRSLSCFQCNSNCDHYEIGFYKYESQSVKKRPAIKTAQKAP